MINRDRFLSYVVPEPNTGCWLWTASVRPNGYGQFSVDRVARYTHRLSYEMHVGPIPEGASVLHSCDVPSCVNPDHLSLGTQGDNMRDASKKRRLRNRHSGKTHCHNGHAYTGANLIQRTDGARTCRACNNKYRREWARAKTAMQRLARGAT